MALYGLYTNPSKCDASITLDVGESGNYRKTCNVPSDGKTELIDYAAIESRQKNLVIQEDDELFL